MEQQGDGPRNLRQRNGAVRFEDLPAAFQSRSRRQHVMPEPNPNSLGKYSHWMPVHSTYKIPHSTSRFGNGLRPGYRNRRSLLGNSGSIRSHRSSDTIHGNAPMT